MLDAIRQWETEQRESADIAATVKRVRSNPVLYQQFPKVQLAVAWLAKFLVDALRYPLLIAFGQSGTWKTEWAKSLFNNPKELKIGSLTYFPDGMREFCRGVHDGLVLDDVRDLKFLADNQDRLQGKYDTAVEFASTPGGTCAHKKYLYAIRTVVTVNHSTKNLAFLESHDWLGKPLNRVIVTSPLVATPADADANAAGGGTWL